ncbi:hypothetical protein [Clostridium gasigenes]|uniref:hypothetical protein n=1 Tax=Clostridium gasigenes TaxID=94869 RepID=UPI001C0E634C|nr:hypothetical protein [Clostridium gasigenes]MBU3102921.1 hypothetical protein [Clostridium gasigenes]
MEKDILFDLTSNLEALGSLSKFANVSQSEIVSFLNSCDRYNIDYRENYYKFIEKFNIKLDNLRLDNLEIKSIHVTTGNDDGEYILNNGLLNLKEVVKRDTPMNRFLIERGIEIDVENKILRYNKKELIISEDNCRKSNGEKNYVHHKLYRDYLINGFHYNNKPLKYGGMVAYRPEFIYSLGDLIRYRDLEKTWENTFNQCYIVEYKCKPCNIEWNSYVKDIMEDDDGIEPSLEKIIKRWLINNSLYVIFNYILGSDGVEIYSFLKPNYNVPSSDIIKIINVTSKRNNS